MHLVFSLRHRAELSLSRFGLFYSSFTVFWIFGVGNWYLGSLFKMVFLPCGGSGAW